MPIYETLNDEATTAAGLEHFFAAENPPTAILAMSDKVALIALEWLAARGISVPGDVSVIGFDGVPEGETSEPPLTTIGQPMAEMGRRAVENILAFDGTIRRETLDVELIVRGSTSAPRGSAQLGLSRFGSCVCLAQRLDFNLHHIEHGLGDAAGTRLVLVLHHLDEFDRHDLPGHAVSVLQPAAGSPGTALAQRIPKTVDLGLIVAIDDEGHRMVERIHRSGLHGVELDAAELELDDFSPSRAGRSGCRPP